MRYNTYRAPRRPAYRGDWDDVDPRIHNWQDRQWMEQDELRAQKEQERRDRAEERRMAEDYVLDCMAARDRHKGAPAAAFMPA